MMCHENCHRSARDSPVAEDKYSNLLNKERIYFFDQVPNK